MKKGGCPFQCDFFLHFLQFINKTVLPLGNCPSYYNCTRHFYIDTIRHSDFYNINKDI